MGCPVHPHYNWPEIAAGDSVLEGEQLEAISSCSFCLASFLQALETCEAVPPPGFVDRVMDGLPAGEKQRRSAFRGSRARPIFHYLAAASVTMVLVHLGFFDLLADLPALLAGPGPEEFSFLDSILELLAGLFY